MRQHEARSTGSAPKSTHPLLELTGISKRYGTLTANDDISLSVAGREVVALLGENGAGKSTLMKIIYGLVRPDSGSVRMDGRTLDIASPRDAMNAGIGMVTQEFSLVETMTVTENAALSGVGLGRVDIARARQRVMAAMESIGVSIEPDRPVQSLSIGERQRVEIVKALFHECRVLILDEPTAVLTPQDVRALFRTVERLRDAGLGVLFVSHKLKEVAEISDRVAVLRRGLLVGNRTTADVDSATLAGLMMGVPDTAAVDSSTTATAVGIASTDAAPQQETDSGLDVDAATDVLVLTISGLSLVDGDRSVLDGIGLAVRPGEIVGIAGISGNGQTELMEVLCGTRSSTGGSIEVGGVDVSGHDPAGRLSRGLGRLTEDRRGSVVPQLSVAENLVLEDLPDYTRRGLLDRGAIRAHAERMIQQFDIRAQASDPVSSLSGGNMQKVLLARALARRPRVLVVAQPTRGLDIGAYRYVHTQLRDLCRSGAGVLVITEDLDELTTLCDRIAVLFRGELSEAVPADQVTTEALGVMMTGGRASA